MRNDQGRMRRRGEPPTARELTNMVRRLGFVVIKMHEVVLSSLIEHDREGLAEEWNDIVKPVADFLLNTSFDVARDTIPEGDDNA